MRNRKHRIEVRLNDAEYEDFLDKVKKSKLNQQAYIRMLLKGLKPRDAPPPDYYAFKREVNAIGNNLNQIAYVANAIGYIDSVKYDLVVAEYKQTVKRILAAVELPERMDK